MGELSRFLRFGMLFPTSLRGVLVFDSVSRRRLPPPPPPPPVFSLTKNFVTHHLSHTTLSTTTFSHTIFHTQLCHPQLCHTPSFTHNFVTQNFVNHNFFPTSLYLATSTFTLRGRRGTYGTGLALVARLGAVSRPGRRATLCGRRGTW